MVNRSCTSRRGGSIPHETQRLLYASSAGYCQKTECNISLFLYVREGQYASVAEMAHIVAAAADGPRGEQDISPDQLVSLDNLILLCPTCHTLIDKHGEQFPKEVVMGWKKQHEGRIRRLFGLGRHDDRAQLRGEFERLLLHNQAIFETFGPLSEAAEDPLSDAIEHWHREIATSIIPSNRKILELLECHDHLLTEDERRLVARFRVHVDAFEARHLFGEVTASAPQFPQEMNELLKA